MDSTPLKNPQHLVRNRDYSNTESTSTFAAQPAGVQFAGFECNKEAVTHVKIINSSRFTAGLHLLPSTEAAFTFSIVDDGKKHGAVVPGMAAKIRVHFKPTQAKHYESAIRIHCGVRLFHLAPRSAHLFGTSSFRFVVCIYLHHLSTSCPCARQKVRFLILQRACRTETAPLARGTVPRPV